MTSELHKQEMFENRKAWESKPMLWSVYSQFYHRINSRINRSISGEILEIGSGMGNIKTVIPDCRLSDIFHHPWVDRVENAYHLSCSNESVSHLIMMDVWHHLEFPGAALREFRRVLAPEGRVILLEPAMGCLGRLVYGLFHHEPLGLSVPVRWEPPEKMDLEKAPYFASQARASQIFGKSMAWQTLLEFWNIVEVAYWSDLSYLFSGGFREPQLCPEKVLPVVEALDGWLSRIPSLFASRMLVVLEKK